MSDDVKKRNARNKRAGADWETKLVKGLRESGYDVERLHLSGSKDEGDIRIILNTDPTHVVVEAKAGVMHAAEFVRQADVEAKNYGDNRGLNLDDVKGVVIVKARGKNWRDAYVLTTVRSYFGLDKS